LIDMGTTTPTIDWRPLTGERWDDLEKLFGPKGAVGGCWCMLWRCRRKDFDANKGDGNRRALKALIEGGQMPGVLVYRDGQPAGWCSVAPREMFPALERSRILKPVDDMPVWSVSCFYVPRVLRGAGLADDLIAAALAHARAGGARAVEAYPVEPTTSSMPAVFAWTGFAQSFTRAGFVEIARRSPTRPIMRRAVA